MSKTTMGLVVLTSPSFWDMQEVLCHKEDVIPPRWGSSHKKWKATLEVTGIASMVFLRRTGDLTKVSQSKKQPQMKFSAFSAFSNSLQKFGYQLSKLFFPFVWNKKALRISTLPIGYTLPRKSMLCGKNIKSFLKFVLCSLELLLNLTCLSSQFFIFL